MSRVTRFVGLAAASLAAGLVMTTGALAAGGPGNALPDIDLRFAGKDVPATGEQARAARALGDVVIRYTALGTPHSLRAKTGALTKPSNKAPDAIVKSFLRDNLELFRLKPGDVSKLKRTMLDRQAGGTFLRYKQVESGRDVFGSSLLFALDKQLRIVLVGGLPSPSTSKPAAPSVSADEAVSKAALNLHRGPARVKQVKKPSGPASKVEYENTLALPGIQGAKPIQAELVVVPTTAGFRSAWRIRAEVASNADYELLVDAGNGAVFYRKNQVSSSEPHGLVHTGDDPDAGGQVAGVLFSGIDGTWVAGDTTSGNNTNTYQDLPDDDSAAAADQPHNAAQHFDYVWTDPWGTSATLPTAGDERDATVTQLFYYTNWYHDYAYNLGFTETSRNFQEDNFGRGGSDGDAVLAESDDGYGDGSQMLCTDSNGNPILCRNNANFNTNGSDGSNPRMQMYVGEQDVGGGVIRRTQRANNRDTVIHEYTHGISGRIISDSNLAGGLQSGALGEGWGDSLATSINDDPVYGEYNNGNTTTGIRGVAYDNSTLTYGSLCNGGCEVHSDGEIWATMMWEARAALVGKLGHDDAKSLHERLIVLGMKLTPDMPTFVDARDGYLFADAFLALFGDPDAGNNCLLWKTFANNQLGTNAGPDGDDDSTPTTSTTTPASCDPTAVIAPVPSTPEGTEIHLNGSGSSVGGDPGDTLTFAWDLDNDGQYDDSTSATPTVTFGDNGSFTVGLKVTNTAGYSDTASAVITVTNVNPTVTIDAAQLKNVVEGQSLPVLAHFTDPGWLDTYPGATINPGTSFLSTVPGTIAISDEGPPANVGTISGTLTYGDNGGFTVTVSITDDDGGTGSNTFNVTVANVLPIPTIDESGAVIVNGVPTIFVDAGTTIPLSARVQDPGSDDETTFWDWGDGTTTTPVKSRNDPALDDPLPSPNVHPRDFTTTSSHAWAQACMYDVTFNVTDDDGGAASDTIKVLITAPPSKDRGAGYWQHQYKGNGKIDFTPAQLDCYLAIAAFVSNVFNEVRDASTIAKAYDVIFVGGNGGDATQLLDRELLVAWLNFANGGFEWAGLVDIGGGVQMPFVNVMTTAESVRLNPASSKQDLLAQKAILARMNEKDGL